MDLGLVQTLEFRTVLVSADPLVRSGLAQLLRAQPGLAVVAQGSSEESPETVAGGVHPEALIFDLGVDGRVDRLKTFLSLRLPTVALVPDERFAAEAHRAGAKGILLRTAEAPLLAQAVKSVAVGLFVLDEALSGALPGVRAFTQAPFPEPDPLTARETEVLGKLAEGLSNKEIAQALNISDHTAKFHLNAVMQKLGVQNRTEAVVRAVRAGLLML
jgi:two-component system, NarL family, nitrate/nitrite response regulator NarL